MNVTVTVEGADKLAAAFKTVEKGLDFRTLGTWDAVTSEFRKIEKEQFAGEGIGPSGKWKALSAAYAKRKIKKWGSTPILQASGRLVKSLTGNSSDSVVEKTADELTIGTTVPYAGYHQRGTKTMPSRPPVDLSEQHTDRLGKVITRKMKQLVANARLADKQGF